MNIPLSLKLTRSTNYLKTNLKKKKKMEKEKYTSRFTVSSSRFSISLSLVYFTSRNTKAEHCESCRCVEEINFDQGSLN